MDYEENKGLSLLKKGQKGLIHAIFSRMGLILLLLLFEVFILFGIFNWFEKFLPHIWGGTVIFTAGMVLYLLNSRLDPTAKLTWLLVMALLPVFGELLFWYTQSNLGHRALKDRLKQLISQTKETIPQADEVIENFTAENPGAASLTHYLHRTGCFPLLPL